MIKVLLIAPAGDFTHQVAQALTAEGCEVAILDDRIDYSLPRALRSARWLWRLGRRIPYMRRASNEALQKHILSTADTEKPQFLLALKGMNIRRATLEALKRLDITTAVWFPDNAANEPYATWVQGIGPCWDAFFSFDSAIYEQTPDHARNRIHVLPFAVQPHSFQVDALSAEDIERYTCDVCLVGAPYPDRVRLLEQVRDMNIKIWGWSGWEDTSLAERYHGSLNAVESAKAYRLAKICVNTNIRPMPKGANLKTFEIAAAGGFQLTDHPADLDASFAVGHELDVFSDEAQFKEKVQYWLSHEEERKLISQAAQERVLRDHTLRERMKSLLVTMKLG